MVGQPYIGLAGNNLRAFMFMALTLLGIIAYTPRPTVRLTWGESEVARSVSAFCVITGVIACGAGITQALCVTGLPEQGKLRLLCVHPTLAGACTRSNIQHAYAWALIAAAV